MIVLYRERRIYGQEETVNYAEDLARAKYAVDTAWTSLSKAQRINVKKGVHELALYALRHFDFDLHRKAFDLEQLIKKKNSSLSLKEFDRWDRVRLTKRYNGYVKGTVAEVDVYDSSTGTCAIRIQADHLLLQGVPANILTLL